MNVSFSSERFFTTNIAYDFGVDYKTIRHELENETWESWSYGTPMGHENPNWNLRYKLKNPKSPVLIKIMDFVNSDQVRDQVLDMLYSFNPAFQGLWSLDKDQMRKWTSWHMEYMLDKPGFYLEPHNDYRRLVCAGMIYFNEYNDPDVATTFYTDRQYSDPMVVKNGLGTGWLAVNDYCNWHTGKNASNYDRYSALLGLTIKAPEDYDR